MAFFKRKKKDTKIPRPPEYAFPEVEDIKNSINKSDLLDKSEISNLPKLSELEEMPEFPEMNKPKNKTGRLKPVQEAVKIVKKTIKPTAGRRPLFIRVDKFQDVLDSVDIIRQRIQDISAVIKKLREIRVKEEDEMAKWGQEIGELKEKLELIEKTLSRIE